MHTFPTINWWQAQKYVRNLCNVLNYIDYNKKDAMEVVTRELGWRNYGKKHSESLYTKFFQNATCRRSLDSTKGARIFRV